MTDYRSTILEHALPLVPFEGWSEHVLSEAAKAAGLDALALKSAFPGGPIEAVDYFFKRQNEALVDSFSADALASMRVPERIEKLIVAHLKNMAPYREAVRSALAAYALPWNGFHAIRTLCEAVDRIWRLAGDTSTDLNWYTKRATLTTVYSSTILYWLDDRSENFMETKAFLKRRLENIAAFGKWKGNMKKKFRKLVAAG